MNMTTITKRIVSSIVLTAGAVSAISAMDLVMATDSENQSILQSSLALSTNNRWSVSAYEGTDIEMVDDIRQRAVRSELPSAAQIPGATIHRWAALGFINDLTNTSESGSWKSRLPQTIQDDVSFRDRVYAVPTQIHRSNWMWMNSKLFKDENDQVLPPRTWSSFFEQLENKDGGPTSRIITVDDPLQNTLILEAIMLGLKGADFYQQSFMEFDYATLKSAEMIEVFSLLAKLRPWLGSASYPDWGSASRALASGEGDILFAGDWVKPMLMNSKGELPTGILCEPFPEASATFLYNLNSVVLFRETDSTSSDELAKLVFTESLLTDLNIREGSIPARLDISPWGFDRCGVRAMREFRSAHTIDTLQPSLAAGMAAPEGVQKAVYTAVNNFMSDKSMSPEEGVKAMAKAIRVAIYKI
jgi:glucose/mannose transport system substrate-binding protein